MRKLNLIFINLLISTNVFAGAEGGGGGDPRAYEFIAFGKKIITWLDSHPSNLAVDVSLLTQRLKTLEASLDTTEPLVRVPQVDQIDDCTSGPKQGCTRGNGSVDIAGKTWDASRADFKCTLTAQELFLPQVRVSRYMKAAELCEQIAKQETTNKPSNNHDPKNPCNTNPSVTSPGVLDANGGCVYDNPSIFYNGQWVRLTYSVFERDNPSVEKTGYGFCSLQNPYQAQVSMTGGGCDDQTVSCPDRRAMQPLLSLSARGETVNLYSIGDGPLGSVDRLICK